MAEWICALCWQDVLHIAKILRKSVDEVIETMPQAVTIDQSINRTEAIGRMVRVPQGEYLFSCVAVDPMDKAAYEKLANDPDHWPILWFQMKIEEGLGGHGQQMRQVGSLKPDSMFGIGRACKLLGFDQTALAGQEITNYERLTSLAAFLTTKLKGKKVGGSVADRQGTSQNGQIQTYSNIIELYPAADFETRSKANAFAPQTPNGGAAVAPAPGPDQAALMADIGNLF